MIRPETIQEADEVLDWLIDASLASAEWDNVAVLLDRLHETITNDDDKATLDVVVVLDHVLQRGEWEEITEEDGSEPAHEERDVPEPLRERFNKLKHLLRVFRDRSDGDGKR